jgi:hypothetical protein
LATGFSRAYLGEHDVTAVASMRLACGEIVCAGNRIFAAHVCDKSSPGVGMQVEILSISSRTRSVSPPPAIVTLLELLEFMTTADGGRGSERNCRQSMFQGSAYVPI